MIPNNEFQQKMKSTSHYNLHRELILSEDLICEIVLNYRGEYYGMLVFEYPEIPNRVRFNCQTGSGDIIGLVYELVSMRGEFTSYRKSYSTPINEGHKILKIKRGEPEFVYRIDPQFRMFWESIDLDPTFY